MLFGGANTRAETALTITIREPQRQPARALTLLARARAAAHRPRSIGDVVVRAHIRCELRHHRLHLQLALRVRQQRLHHLRLFCSPRTRRQPRPQEWKGRGRDLSAWLVSSPGPFAAHLGSCAPPAAFSARPHAARAQRRVSAGWADGLQPESGRQAKGEGARRARSHPRAPPSVSASSPAPPSASPAAWKRSRSLEAAPERSVRVGLAHLRPPQLRLQRRLRLLHLIDEHDELLHLARRHLPSASAGRHASTGQGASHERWDVQAQQGQARWAGLLKGDDEFAQAHI